MELYSKALKRRDIAAPKDASINDDSSKTKNNAKNPAEKKNASSTGSIVNLMSTDTIRIANFSDIFHEFIRSPVELIVAITLLYQLLGTSCFLGLLILVFALPLNHYAAIKLSSTQESLMETRDRRIESTTEIIQGIRQVKFFAWYASTSIHSQIRIVVI